MRGPPLLTLVAWGQLEHPRCRVPEAPYIVISVFCRWSPAEASPAALSTHANSPLPSCLGDGTLAASPCTASLTLFNFCFPFFFPQEGKVSLIPGMPEKGPLRITLAKPLSLQEIRCLLKKVVGVENQGEVLFFLSFSLFPWKVITGLKKSPFFGTQVFLATVFHSSPFFFLFFFQMTGGILEVENLKAGACKRGGESNGRAVLTGKRC